jgi:hypothetical protein
LRHGKARFYWLRLTFRHLPFLRRLAIRIVSCGDTGPRIGVQSDQDAAQVRGHFFLLRLLDLLQKLPQALQLFCGGHV